MQRYFKMLQDMQTETGVAKQNVSRSSAIHTLQFQSGPSSRVSFWPHITVRLCEDSPWGAILSSSNASFSSITQWATVTRTWWRRERSRWNCSTPTRASCTTNSCCTRRGYRPRCLTSCQCAILSILGMSAFLFFLPLPNRQKQHKQNLNQTYLFKAWGGEVNWRHCTDNNNVIGG